MYMRYLILALLLTLSVSVLADNNSSDGLALLKNDHSARAAGMGGAFVSIAGDANASAYNPAGVVSLPEATFSFGHTSLWENVRLESGFFAKDIAKNWYWLVGLRFATIDDLELRMTPSTEPDAMFDAHDISMKTGFAWQVKPDINVAIAAGWFLEEIEGWRGTVFNLDAGLQWKALQNINLGAAVNNLGNDFHLEKAGAVDSDNISLPTTYRFGGSYQYDKYLGAVDVVILDDKAHLHLGAEGHPHEYLMLRGGYMFGYDTKNFTAGTSFVHRNITVDYGFVPFTSNLGTSHLFNITFSL